jgi:hypothetical protein
MSTTTQHFEFIKPDLKDAADITSSNSNWDVLDAKLKNIDDSLVDLSKIGTYEGAQNSGSGSDHEIVLWFDFVPKLVIVQGNTWSAFFVRGSNGYAHKTDRTHIIETVWENQTLKYGAKGTDFDCAGQTYTYIGIG